MAEEINVKPLRLDGFSKKKLSHQPNLHNNTAAVKVSLEKKKFLSNKQADCLTAQDLRGKPKTSGTGILPSQA